MALAASRSSFLLSFFNDGLKIGEIGGIGSGRDAAIVGCMMVVAAGAYETEAVVVLCLDRALRIPAGIALKG